MANERHSVALAFIGGREEDFTRQAVIHLDEIDAFLDPPPHCLARLLRGANDNLVVFLGDAVQRRTSNKGAWA